MRQTKQLTAAHASVILQSVMRRYLDDDSTGGTIAVHESAPYPLLPRMWDLLGATSMGEIDRSATTGVTVVIYKYISGARKAIQVAAPAIATLHEVLPAMPKPAVVISPAAAVDMARSIFGLNISETADVFHVSRPTIYQWMKLEDIEQVRSREDRERIKAIFQAAQLWQESLPLKGRWRQAILPSGTTVLDILKAQQFDPDALKAAYTTLAASTEARRKEEGERAQQAISKLAEAFSELASESKARKGTP